MGEDFRHIPKIRWYKKTRAQLKFIGDLFKRYATEAVENLIQNKSHP